MNVTCLIYGEKLSLLPEPDRVRSVTVFESNQLALFCRSDLQKISWFKLPNPYSAHQGNE
jgi:hypothetical protein